MILGPIWHIPGWPVRAGPLPAPDYAWAFLGSGSGKHSIALDNPVQPRLTMGHPGGAWLGRDGEPWLWLAQAGSDRDGGHWPWSTQADSGWWLWLAFALQGHYLVEP